METPESIAALSEIVRSHPKVAILGSGSKNRLASFDSDYTKTSTRKLSGILQYDASEYTLTALAGTPLSEINTSLREQGQYLPFSPVLVKAGATLGGTVASGLAGAGRFRFGSIRDFIIGVRFIDGDGKLISLGGKVVKNAAGFDVSKLLVGSLGRLGIMTELTFKVFPKAEAFATWRLDCQSHDQAIERLMQAAALPWELDALDYVPQQKSLYLRISGPAASLDPMGVKMKTVYPQLEALTPEAATAFWDSLREFAWATENALLAKIPITPKQLAPLLSRTDPTTGLTLHATSGAACAWAAATTEDDLDTLDNILNELKMPGLVFRGHTSKLWLGSHAAQQIERAVKRAMDPPARFPDL